MKLEIQFDAIALALVLALLPIAGLGYYGWQTFRSGLELREQTKWIRALVSGADPSNLNIPQSDRYGVELMAQMARKSGLAESDWQTFEREATNQLRNGAPFMAGSVLLAGTAIACGLRKSLPKGKALVGSARDKRNESAATDQQQDA